MTSEPSPLSSPVSSTRDGLDGHLTRHFSGRCAAHTVADHEQAFLGPRHVGVLVLRANPSGIGARADSQPHRAGDYKPYAGMVRGRKWLSTMEIRSSCGGVGGPFARVIVSGF